MSKYIKLEDAIEAYNQAVTLLVESEMEEFNLGDFTECSFNTTQIKLIARMIESLPTIEVSEDCISKAYLEKRVACDREDIDCTVCFKEAHCKALAKTEQEEGEWILECDAEGEGDNLYRCPECGQRCGCQEYDLPNYCGNCGAKMKWIKK